MAKPIIIQPWRGKVSFHIHNAPRLSNYIKEWYVGSVYRVGYDRIPKHIDDSIQFQICEHLTDNQYVKETYLQTDSNYPVIIFHPEGDYKYFKFKDYKQYGSVVSCNYAWKSELNYFKYWGYDYLSNIKHKSIQINKPTELRAKFLCLNGKPDWHRYYTIQKLYNNNLWKFHYISFLNRYGNYNNPIHQERFHDAFKNEGPTDYVDAMIQNKTELVLDKDTVAVSKDDRTHSPYLFENSSISLITETYSDSNRGLFITEKSWRPLAQCHLPIWIAQPYIVQAFRNFGFDMFDDIIDNSYDTIKNDVERFNAAIESLQKLLQDIHKIDKQSTLERLYNNQSKYLNMRITEEEILSWLPYYLKK